MLSQNIAKTTVFSGSYFRYEFPQAPYMNQWKGVYYFAGMSKTGARKIMLQRKRFVANQNQTFNASTAKLVAESKAATVAVKNPKQLTSAEKFKLLNMCTNLHSFGQFEEGSKVFDMLHEVRALHSNDYAAIIQSLSASALRDTITATDASFDTTLALKLVGDRRGSDRLAEAKRVLECCQTVFPSESQSGYGGLGIRHMNALMNTATTCGYDAMESVSGVLYDQLETLRLAPTVETYRMVYHSLGFAGKVDEATAILRFLETNHADELNTEFYNTVMSVYRDNQLFEECDALWEQLVDHRCPKPDATTAEIYLRSVVDRSYRASADPMKKWGELGPLEKKRIPIILNQMERVGIPRSHLSTSLTLEVEDGLRKFSIYKNRFYEWGRAVKQFSYIEARRKYGWLHDLNEMNITRDHAPLYRNPDQIGKTVGPAGSVELPSWYNEKDSWLVPPLDHVLNRIDTAERHDGGRGAGDVFYDERQSIHERSSSWMMDAPQTRYDQLYGLTNPDIPKIGIRRHLGPEYQKEEDVARRDTTLLKNALSKGRRLKKKMDRERTHRNAAE